LLQLCVVGTERCLALPIVGIVQKDFDLKSKTAWAKHTPKRWGW
jgi:hypothetical protein